MAALLQLALPGRPTNRVAITFGSAIAGDSLNLHAAVIEVMRALIGSA
jgi:hypothetical protein